MIVAKFDHSLCSDDSFIYSIGGQIIEEDEEDLK